MSKFYGFLRRLFFFAIGLVIGIFILKNFFNKKNAEFDYMPNARTLKSISNKPLVYFSDEAKDQLKQLNIDSVQAMTLLDFGKVNFKASQLREKPCQTYQIEPTKKTPPIIMSVQRCDSVSIIKSIIKF